MGDSHSMIPAAAISASANVSAAAAAARGAQNAAEESLEMKARFVLIPVAKFEKVDTGKKLLGLFTSYKQRLAGVERVISIKTTDVANLETSTDDYGSQYVLINLEDRSEVENEDGETLTAIYVPMSISDVTDILNGSKQYK